jgi:hypothetical protein
MISWWQDIEQPVLKARWKCCVKFLTAPSLRTCLPAQPLGPVTMNLKPNILKHSSFGSSIFKSFFYSANALLRQNEMSNMDTQVSELDCMDFSSLNGLSCIVSANQLVSMWIWCSTENLWGKRTLNPKSKGSWKSKSIDDKLFITSFNLHAGSMQQSRRNHFEQNHLLMKISAKKCRPSGLHSQQGGGSKRDERDREC